MRSMIGYAAYGRSGCVSEQSEGTLTSIVMIGSRLSCFDGGRSEGDEPTIGLRPQRGRSVFDRLPVLHRLQGPRNASGRALRT